MPSEDLENKFQTPGSALESNRSELVTSRKKSKILIVQGDWEAGLGLLAQDLEDEGHQVGKVIFCASDYIYKFFGIRTHVYRDKIDNFQAWVTELIKNEGYDTVFLYNHYRPYNQIVWDLSEKMTLECWVFELGLIRPNCVMVFEKNSFPLTTIAEKWDKILKGAAAPEKHITPPELCRVSTPVKLVNFGANFVFSRLTSPLFPNFIDQRDMHLGKHVKHGLIHLWRFFQRAGDEEYDTYFATELSGKYYAVPLQVHSDTQILQNSTFESIEEFVATVVESFEKHAPKDTKLVFKVHPMDRGYKDYADLIDGLNHRIGEERLFYVDRVHLPTLLENARGLVNINSSVGISALIHGNPVIALGNAVYDLPELTFQGDLDDFWTQAPTPQKRLVNHFLNLLLETCQGRGTLSQRCFDVPGRTRIRWPIAFSNSFFNRP
ncbi:hypothetical protein [Luteolibacter sp. AS25]|uniref:capsular polysaccharide export protein, LipB/KpsS family n=1 Tax=Luteolibacter sp. AS25 TaxID=3135776 RepID=UPI00398A8C88